jgi:uncharacterized protein YihD (DUF1040 family)
MHKILIIFFVSTLGLIVKADETVLKGYVYKVWGGQQLMSYKDYLEVLKNKDYKDFIDKVDECIKKEDYSCLSKYGNLKYESNDSAEMYSIGLNYPCNFLKDSDPGKEKCFQLSKDEFSPVEEKIKNRESGYRFVLWKVFQEVVKHKDRCSFEIGKNEKVKDVAGFSMYCKVSILKALPERIQKLYKQYGKKKDFDGLEDEVMVYSLDLERKRIGRVFDILNRDRDVEIELMPVQ